MKEETKNRIWKTLGVVALIVAFSFFSGLISYDYGRSKGIELERGTSLLEPVVGHLYQITICAVPVTSGQRNGYYRVLGTMSKKEHESLSSLSYELKEALTRSPIFRRLAIYDVSGRFKEATIKN